MLGLTPLLSHSHRLQHFYRASLLYINLILPREGWELPTLRAEGCAEVVTQSQLRLVVSRCRDPVAACLF